MRGVEKTTLDEKPGPEEVILRATGRRELTDALAWIAEGHSLLSAVNPSHLLRAVSQIAADYPGRNAAIRRLARLVTASSFDSSSVVLRQELIEPLDTYRKVLDLLAWKSPTKTLAGMSPSVFGASQRENPKTVEVLCAVAGLSYRELNERCQTIPSNPASPWAASSIEEAFGAIEAALFGKGGSSSQGAVSAQPVEFVLGANVASWETVEQMRRGGVTYETLLAQRAVGSAWGAHRNRTSGDVTQEIVGEVCSKLDNRKLSYWRSKAIGGSVSKERIRELVGGAGQIGVVLIDSSERPAYGVAFSTASNGATARKNVGRLVIAAAESQVPLAVVAIGRGWPERNETGDLAAALSGRLFGDTSLDLLVEDMEQQLDLGGRSR